MKRETVQQGQQQNRKVEVSPRATLKGKIDFAKVVVTDASSGKIVSSKRVVLLAE